MAVFSNALKTLRAQQFLNAIEGGFLVLKDASNDLCAFPIAADLSGVPITNGAFTLDDTQIGDDSSPSNSGTPTSAEFRAADGTTVIYSGLTVGVEGTDTTEVRLKTTIVVTAGVNKEMDSFSWSE